MLNQELNLSPKIFDPEVEKIPSRYGFGDGLIAAAEKDTNIVVLTADLAESTRTHEFSKKFPDRFIEIGIAEQNMAGIAAGLAISGKTPFAASFGAFNTAINWIQIKISVCYSNSNVKIVGSHAGVSASADGVTQQSLEDIATMRVLPNMTVIYPCDYEEAKKATLALAAHKGPVYLRLLREATPVLTTAETPFEIGQAQVWAEGTDITVISTGPSLFNVLSVVKHLSTRGLSCEVINCSTIKPLDSETILKSVKKTKKVVTVEEHQIAGGLGSAVAELLSEVMPVPIKRVGVNNTFAESGKYEELLNKYGIGQKAIELAILEMYKK